MAMMAGMPGWAMAKGSGKTNGQQGAYPHVQQMDVDAGQQLEGVPSPRAGAVLAQIKEMLRSGKIDRAMVSATPASDASQWQMELLGQQVVDGSHHEYMNLAAHNPSGGDPRIQGSKPVGVSFRLKF